MSDERNKANEEQEQEFYHLLQRRPRPQNIGAPNQQVVRRAPAASSAEGERRTLPRQDAQTRLTDMSRVQSSQELPPLGGEEARPAVQPATDPEPVSRPARDFHLHVDDELKKIPDYSLGEEQTKRRSGVGSAFAKAMFCIFVLGISVLLSIAILFCVQEVFGFGKEDRLIEVEIPRNAGLSTVAEKLEATQVIRSADLFKVYFKLVEPEGEFQYGTYELNSKMSYDEMLTCLFQYSTQKEEITVTIPEGFTVYQMAQRLEEKGVCDAADFIQTLNEYDFSEKYEFLAESAEDPLQYHKLEGYLFPDTYNFYTHDDPVNVADKMLRNFQNKMSGLEERRQELGLTMEQTVTIASIIQQEAGRSADMTMVASVYWNRLNNEGSYPFLQADPTRKYAEELMEQMGDQIDQAVLNAYNTYEGQGLPPGAICNPGYAALEAALNPAESDYFYFCNNLETGEFFYAKTLQEHERNLVRAGLV